MVIASFCILSEVFLLFPLMSSSGIVSIKLIINPITFSSVSLSFHPSPQVILSHMEVYEKSLKQAQRCLLRKAEWGEAVLPQPEVQ